MPQQVSYHQSFHFVLQRPNLRLQVARLICRDARRKYRPADAACATQCHLAWDVDIWDILILTQKGQVEEDSERGGVGGENNNFGDAAIQSFGCCEKPSVVCLDPSMRID